MDNFDRLSMAGHLGDTISPSFEEPDEEELEDEEEEPTEEELDREYARAFEMKCQNDNEFAHQMESM